MAILNLRPLLSSDAELLFNWVNEDEVRQNSIHKEPITWENHKSWFCKKLQDQNTKMFILEDNHRPVGQIRFDLLGDVYEIDYSVDSKHRGRGYGSELVKKGIKELNVKPGTELIAKVKQGNLGSIRVFEKNGFNLIRSEEIDVENYLVFRFNRKGE